MIKEHIAQLRAKLIMVPKPGTSPRTVPPGGSIHSIMNFNPKPGDDAGEQTIGPLHAGNWNSPPLPMVVQAMVWELDPYSQALADELERTSLRNKTYMWAVEQMVQQIHEKLKRGKDTQDHGLMGNLKCILDHLTDVPSAL